MAELPTGTVTFLFTDLEGSTRLWEQHPDAMKDAMARHDEILRDAIAAHDGHVVKMTGDGVHAAFRTAQDAIGAAVESQRALASEEWREVTGLRVRMGLHTGAAESRDGDYYGPAVNKAARLMSAANGGQIVVSLATEELVHDVLPDDVLLEELGEHRFRDLSRAERVFGVAAPGLVAGFAPLRSLDAYPTNLPVQVSSFIGRAEEMKVVQKALGQSRLVTLTGVGGSGKTRLAVQVAAEMLPQYSDGAWLCELAAASDGDVLVQVVAATLGVSVRPGMTLDASVLAFLREREILVVLDNCEHLLEAAGRLADSVAHTCPRVRILATSREGLAVEGERIVPLRSMPVPGAAADVLHITASDAVRLFVERADAARTGFVVDDWNAGAIAEICRRLDGMPLAIELAAARVTGMRPIEIAGLLDERFRLLTGGRRTAVERHQTLRATVDWSYSLLDERDRLVFDRLGVFAGSFDAAAAMAVAAGPEFEPWDALDALTSLVAKSMVVDEEAPDGTTRYSMLETLRHYAREQLDDHGQSDNWRCRHAQYYADSAEKMAVELRGPDELVWRPRFRADLDNLRAAVVWSLDAPTPDHIEPGLRIVAAFRYEVVYERTAGIAAWAERAVNRTAGAPVNVEAAVTSAAAWAAFVRGDLDAAITRGRAAIETGSELWAYQVVTCAEWLLGGPERGRQAVTPNLRAAESVDDKWELAGIRVGGAFWEAQAGDAEAARTYATEGVRRAREVRNPSLLASALSAFASVWWEADPKAALGAVTESIELTRHGAGDAAFSNALAVHALLQLDADPEGALGTLRESLVWGARSGDHQSTASSIDRAARIFAERGTVVPAIVLGAAADGPLRHLNTVPVWERAARVEFVGLARLTLGDDKYERAVARGKAMSYQEAYEFTIAAIDALLAEMRDA